MDLADTSFPALAPFTQMAQDLLGLLLARHRNKIVQQFTIGFDFSSEAVELAKLRQGTYVAAQVKRNELPWSDWAYQRTTGLVVKKSDLSVRLPYNHVTFNVVEG